jgi:P-type Cu2+ transporter
VKDRRLGDRNAAKQGHQVGGNHGHDHHIEEEKKAGKPGYPEHPETAHPHGHPPQHEAEHDRHAGHSVEMFKNRFWLSLVLTIPVVLYSHEIQELLRFRMPEFPGSAYIPPVLGTFIFFYGGAVFLRGALQELRHRLPGMMTLISVAITAAFLFSLGDTMGIVAGELWWELSTLVTVMLLGHWIEMRSIGRAQGALRELAKLLPDTAERVLDGMTETVLVHELRRGDLILIRPGSRMAIDGQVIGGSSSVNEAMITGESRPVEKQEGDPVIGGTVNGEGSLRVEVTRTGAETTLGGIMRLVEEAQASRSRAQDLADRAAFVLTIVALGVGGLTLFVWLFLGAEVPFAVERMVAVMVVACPHALGLAIPLVIAISTTLGARAGLLVRRRLALEQARRLDEVVFDKTGTLTKGEFGVASFAAVSEFSETEAFRLAAAAEADSEHPLARAIVREAQERGLQLPAAEDFSAIPGRGVRARVSGREIQVGQPALLRDLQVELPPQLEDATRQAEGKGESVVFLIVDGKPLAIIGLADLIRPESYEAVQRLKSQGIRVAMLTGDSEAVAKAVAGELGIDHYFARVLPEEKSRRIQELRDQGRRVAMVGDGVNDAPALLAADVGIAIGAGTNVAVEAGDIILIKNDPRDVARLVALSRASYRKMVQNLIWATGYNVVAIPLAAGVLAGYGILLIPAAAAVLMSASTVIVAVNAQLLRRAEPEITGTEVPRAA